MVITIVRFVVCSQTVFGHIMTVWCIVTIIQLTPKLLLCVGQSDYNMILDQLRQRQDDVPRANEAASDCRTTVVQETVFWDYSCECDQLGHEYSRWPHDYVRWRFSSRLENRWQSGIPWSMTRYGTTRLSESLTWLWFSVLVFPLFSSFPSLRFVKM